MKERFLELFNSEVNRQGAAEFIQWLESTDFFIAPASTKFHLSRDGGLVEHSINVYERFRLECEFHNIDMPSESIALCSLLHDVCKANFYKVEMRNAKNEYGQWVKVPYYTVDDQLPYGHGEKSVYIISGFMKLSREEAMAIRWHMGAFDEAVKGGSYSMGAAYEKYPVALLLHIADMKATYFDEAEQ